MPAMKMPAVANFGNDDEIIIHQGGKKRRLTRGSLFQGIEQRLNAVEAPGNGSLASRVGSIEQWRANKAAAIADVSMDMTGMGVSVGGFNVASNAAMQSKLTEHATAINQILSANREREIISA